MPGPLPVSLYSSSLFKFSNDSNTDLSGLAGSTVLTFSQNTENEVFQLEIFCYLDRCSEFCNLLYNSLHQTGQVGIIASLLTQLKIPAVVLGQ